MLSRADLDKITADMQAQEERLKATIAQFSDTISLVQEAQDTCQQAQDSCKDAADQLNKGLSKIFGDLLDPQALFSKANQDVGEIEKSGIFKDFCYD